MLDWLALGLGGLLSLGLALTFPLTNRFNQAPTLAFGWLVLGGGWLLSHWGYGLAAWQAGAILLVNLVVIGLVSRRWRGTDWGYRGQSAAVVIADWLFLALVGTQI